MGNPHQRHHRPDPPHLPRAVTARPLLHQSPTTLQSRHRRVRHPGHGTRMTRLAGAASSVMAWSRGQIFLLRTLRREKRRKGSSRSTLRTRTSRNSSGRFSRILLITPRQSSSAGIMAHRSRRSRPSGASGQLSRSVAPYNIILDFRYDPNSGSSTTVTPVTKPF